MVMLAVLCWPAANAQILDQFWSNFEGFNDNAKWTLVNGSCTNKWCIGNPGHAYVGCTSGSVYGMYISNDGGTTNAYTNTQPSLVYAYHELYLLENTSSSLYFNWRASGESDHDYLRVALIPSDYPIEAGTVPNGFGPNSLPNGWIALDGGSQLCQDTTWVSKSIPDITVPASGYYKFAFIWVNDGSGGTSLPAAVDNITFYYYSYPQPVAVNNYFYDGFEEYPSLWESHNSTSVNAWINKGIVNHGGYLSLYVSNNGGTNTYTNDSPATIYASRMITFEAGKYDFSFDWQCKGEECCDYLRAALVPGTPELTGSATAPNGLSLNSLPTGWIALDGGTKLNMSDGWVTQETYDVDIPDSGVYTMVFVWCNDNSVGTNPPAAVDNLSITKVTCPTPKGLAVSDITGTTATLQFNTYTESNNFTYVLDKAADFDITDSTKYATMTGNSGTLTGLEPLTTYKVAIRANCPSGNGESHWSAPATFITTPDCGSQAYRQFVIGNHETDSWSLPFAYPWSNNTVGISYQIFTAEEILEEAEFAGTINGLAWMSTEDVSVPFHIYLANTDKNIFDNDSDIVNAAYMTKVYEGTTQFTADEWTDIVFDTPFEYDATSNLLVMVYRPVPASISQPNFKYTTLGSEDYKSIYRYGNVGLTGGTRQTRRNNTRFMMCVDEDACLPVQDLRITQLQPRGAVVRWEDLRNASSVTYQTSFVLEGVTPNIANSNPYNATVSNLGCVPNTTYNYYVRANCGSGNYSKVKKITFTTPCDTIALPYSCDFESVGEESYPLPECWQRYNDAPSSYNTRPYVTSAYSQAHSGGKALYLYAQTGSAYSDNQIAILPAAKLGSSELVFWAKKGDYCDHPTYIEVGSMSTPNDISSFRTAATLELTSEYKEYVVRNFGYSGIRYVAIRMQKPAAYYMEAYVDDVTLQVKSACPKPLYPQASNITSNSATISWTGNNVTGRYIVIYGTADGTTMDTIIHSDYSLTRVLNNLEANTPYMVKVAADCSGDGTTISEWSQPCLFRTACGTTNSLPYTENFDAYSNGISSTTAWAPNSYPNVDLPQCWSFPNMSESDNNYPQSYLASSYSSRGYGKTLICSVTNGDGPWFAVLPKFTEDINNLMLTFDYGTLGSGACSVKPILKVGYMTDPSDTSTFHELLTCVESCNDFTTQELLFDSVPYYPNARIAFKAVPRWSSSEELMIDNVTVEVRPTCFKPENLTVTRVTHNSASLVWEIPQTNGIAAGQAYVPYQLAYGPAATFDLNNPSTYQTTGFSNGMLYPSCNLNNLFQPGTKYAIAVKMDCGNNDWSAWSLPVTFTTSCLVNTPTYTENFDSYQAPVSHSSYTSLPSGYPNLELPDCWVFPYRGDHNSPYVFLLTDSNYATSGNALMMHTERDAASAYAVMPKLSTPLRDLQLSFTYSFYREDYETGDLAVGFMTNPVDTTTFVPLYFCMPYEDIMPVELAFDTLVSDTITTYIAFKYSTTSWSSQAYVGIDNVVVEPIPDCRKPIIWFNDDLSGPTEFDPERMYFRFLIPNSTPSDTFYFEVAASKSGVTFDLENPSSYNTFHIDKLSGGSSPRTTLIFTGPGTEYSFAARVRCGENTWSDWSNILTRRSECEAVSLPYSEYFDSYTHGISPGTYCHQDYPNVDLPECWRFVFPSELRTENPQVFLTSSKNYSRSGNSLMLFGSVDEPLFAMLPSFENTDPLEISFYYAYESTSSSSGKLYVGYVPQPYNNGYFNFNSFETLDSCPVTNRMTYMRVTLSDTLPTGARIALKFVATSENSGVSIDEVEVLPAGSCEGPGTVRILHLTPTMADVTWDFNYYNEYGVYDTTYGAYAVAFGPAATFNIHNNSTYSVRGVAGSGCCGSYYLDNLEPNTEYAFAAAQICSDDSFSNWSRVATARTHCLPYNTLPYTEDFESYTQGISTNTSWPEDYPDVDLPECWNFMDSKAKAPAYLYNSWNAISGNSLVLNPDSYDTVLALLPTFTEDIRNLKLSFTYKNENDYEKYPKLSVGYMVSYWSSGAPSLFVKIADLPRTETATHVEFLFDSVSEYDATHHIPYLAIRCEAPNWSGQAYIDNVKVEDARCPSIDSLPFTVDFESYTGSSTSNVSTNNLPLCWYNFNTGTSSNYSGYPIIYNYGTYAASGHNSMRFYTLSTSGTYSDQIAILPEINVNTHPMNTLQLSLDARSGNSSYPLKLTIGVMTDPNDASTFVPVETITTKSTTYATYEIPFTHYTGNGSYIALKAAQPATDYNSGYVDNLVVDLAPTCTKPTNVEISQITGTSALVTWTEAVFGATGYTLSYTETGTNNWSSQTVTGNSFMLSNLNPETDYTLTISSICMEGADSAVTKTFSTPCLYNETIQIGESNTTVASVPVHNYYKYSFSEQIFLASELNGENDIISISFNYAYPIAMTKKTDVNIYLKHTTQSSFSNSTNYIAPDGAQLVYHGDLNCKQGWNTFYLTTPFHYNGTDNLVLIVDDNSNGYDGNAYTFQVHNAGATRTHFFYSDSYNPQPDSLSSFQGSKTTSSNRNNVVFGFPCDSTITCIAPNVCVTDVTGNSMTLAWVPGNNESSWELEFSTDQTTWTSKGTVSSSPYTLNNLTNSTLYYVRMRSVCGGGEHSDWTVISQHTACGPISSIPYTEDFDSHIGSSSSSLAVNNLPYCWNYYNEGTASSYIGYPIIYKNTTYASSGSNAMRFYVHTASGYSDQMAILPQIDPILYPVSSLQLSFDARYQKPDDYTSMFTAVVGILTDPSDKTTFTPIDTFVTTSNTYAHYECSFSHYTGSGSYIAILAPKPIATTYNVGYIDNIVVEVSTCPIPKYVTSSNPTQNSLTLSWTEMGNASAWDIEYGLKGFTLGNGTTVHTTSNPCTITGLTFATEYDFYVRANCGGGDSSLFSKVYTAGTECFLISDMPFTENFDSYSASTTTNVLTNNLPYCWSYINNGTAMYYSYFPILYSSSSTAASGRNSLRFYVSYSSTYEDQVAVLPQIDVLTHPVNTLKLAFDARCNSEPFTAVVGIMTDPTNISTFVPIDTIETTANNYIHYEFPFNHYTGNGSYIAIMAPKLTTNYNTGSIDNIVVDILPSCITPKDVTVSDMTQNSITLSWTETGNAAAWDIEYGPIGFMPGSGTTVTGVTANPYTITGLAESTAYDFYVRANCGNSVSNYANRVSTSTPCAPIGLPLFENFDAYDANTLTSMKNLPYCWSSINTGTTYRGLPNIYPYTSYAASGNNSLRFTVYSSSGYEDQIAVLPQIDVTTHPMNTVKLSLDGRKSSSNSDFTFELVVGVMTDPTDKTTFDIVDTIIPESLNYATYTVEFSNYGGTGSYIALMTKKLTSKTNAGYVDNVKVFTCSEPMNVTASNPTATSIDLSWTEGNASAWEIEYGPTGFTRGSGTMVTATSNHYTVTGLSHTTVYDFYVRANCGSGNISVWSDGIQATTTMIPVNLPYTANFTDTNDIWLLNNGNCPNYWMRGTVDNDGALFVTNNGTTPGYNNSQSSTVAANKLFTVGTNDTITIIYDVIVRGEGGYDYLKMFLAPASEQYPASTAEPVVNNYGHRDYSTYAYAFYTNGIGPQSDYYYILNYLTDTIHVVAKMPNPNANPTANSTAQLVFAWRNDGSQGDQPPAIIKNLTVAIGNPCDPVVVDVTHPYTDDFERAQCWQLINGQRLDMGQRNE